MEAEHLRPVSRRYRIGQDLEFRASLAAVAAALEEADPDHAGAGLAAEAEGIRALAQSVSLSPKQLAESLGTYNAR